MYSIKQFAEMFTEPAVTALAERYGKTPAQVLLRFLTQKGVIVIPRSAKPDHIRQNLDVFDFALTADELTALEKLDQATAFIGNPHSPELVEMSLSW